MAYNFKEMMERPDRLTPGHRMCAGCGGSIALRNVLKAVKPEDHAVICNATSCMEVSTFMYPYTCHGRIPIFTQPLKMQQRQHPARRPLTEP